MAKKRIRLHLDCPDPGPQETIVMTQGIPFAQGDLRTSEAGQIVDERGTRYPTQNRVLATWDREGAFAKWVLVDSVMPSHVAAEERQLYLEYPVSREGALSVTGGGDEPSGSAEAGKGRCGPEVTVVDEAGVVTFDTGKVRLRLRRNHADFLQGLALRKVDGWEPVLSGRRAAYLYMSDGAGNCYDSVTAAPKPSVTVEEAGPLRASLCLRGWLANESGIRFCPYILRIHAFAGRSDLRIFHTIIFDQDLERVTFASIGLRLACNVGRVLRYSTGGDREVHASAVAKSFHLRHLSDQEYQVYCDGKKRWEGRRAPGWVSLEGSEAAVAVCLRDMWREYPKGIGIDAKGKIDLQLWLQEHADPLSFPTRLKEEVIRGQTEEELLEKLKRNPTAAVNFKGFLGDTEVPRTEAEGNVASLKQAKAFAEEHLMDRDVIWGDGSCGKAVGLAKTHEFWLDLRPPAPELALDEPPGQRRLWSEVGVEGLGLRGLPGQQPEERRPDSRERTAAWARLIDAPPIAPADPEYVCATDVLRLLHPEDHERFRAVEEGLGKVFEACIDGPVETCRLYGAIDYGDIVNGHARMHGPLFLLFKDEPGVKFTDLVGWMNNEANDVCENLWLGYARSPKRSYWQRAEAYSEHLEDVDTTHAHPTDDSWVGLIHYHNLQHWSGGPSPSHTQINGYLLHYYLTGNRRAFDVSREAAGWALRHLEPAGHVSQRTVNLRREFTGPMATLWTFYQATWEEAYGDAARKSLDFFLKTQWGTGAWPGILGTGGLRGEEAVGDQPEEPGGGGNEQFEQTNFYDVYRITGDERIKRAVIACADWEHRNYYDPAKYGKNYGPGWTPPSYFDHETYEHPLMLATFWLAFAHDLTGDEKYLGPLRELLEHFPQQAEDMAAFTGKTIFQHSGMAVQNLARAMAAVAKAEATR